jgi:type I restriction enzyme, R subunit
VDEGGTVPRSVEPEALNRWLLNEGTVDKVLEHLVRSREKVADGDHMGEDHHFAKNHAHAQLIGIVAGDSMGCSVRCLAEGCRFSPLG